MFSLSIQKIINYALISGFKELIIQSKKEEYFVYFLKSEKIIEHYKIKEVFFKELKTFYFFQINQTVNYNQNLSVKINLNNQLIELKITHVLEQGKEYFILKLIKEDTKIIPWLDFFISQAHHTAINNYLKNPQGLAIINSENNPLPLLYGLLDSLKTSEKNIYSLELNLLARLHGINQIEINPRLGKTQDVFLRFLLREKFDLLALDSLNTSKSARLVSEAISSGRPILICSTCIDPAESLVKLIELGMEPVKISQALKLFISNTKNSEPNKYAIIDFNNSFHQVLRDPRLSLRKIRELIN